MKIIVDTNILLAVAMNEPEKPKITRITSGMELFAPEVLPFEIGNAISALLKKKIITSDEAFSVWAASQQIPVDIITGRYRNGSENSSAIQYLCL